MTMLSPYRERAPRTRDVEVPVKRWAIAKPFSRRQVWADFGLMCCWLICSLIDVIQLIYAYAPKHWIMLGIHLICVAGWGACVGMKIERRTEMATKQITE